MAPHFRKAMDALYMLCVLIAGSALVLISAVGGRIRDAWTGLDVDLTP